MLVLPSPPNLRRVPEEGLFEGSLVYVKDISPGHPGWTEIIIRRQKDPGCMRSSWQPALGLDTKPNKETLHRLPA